ncbi:MAG TPA: T9SS type A sorting domain-containing protein [Flavobacteriales bacterium]|nr:T9SS type A sorting domain-containing protein [Flavobacteriales bacterium]
MARPYLITLALVYSCAIGAQPTFERFYQSGTSYTFDLIELPGHNILTCMAVAHILDPEGSIEYSSAYHGGGTYLTQTLKAAGPNSFYFTTATVAAECPFGDAALVYTVLGKMDSVGTTATVNRYTPDPGYCSGLPGGLEITEDLGAITWGRDKNFFALRVDETFQPIWAKRVARSGGFQFLKGLPGGDLLAGINMDTAGAVLARLDPNGNFIWSKSYIRPRGIVQDALIESDDSFIITGSTDSTKLGLFTPLPASYQPKLFMMKLNGEGDVQWCKGYDSAPYNWPAYIASKIKKTADGDYVVLATLGELGYNFEFRPFLMKTDLNGDTLWTQSLGRNGYSYGTNNLALLSDGGILFNGIIYGDLPGGNTGMNYIFKSDAMGHLPCWEQDYSVQTLDLFPVDSSFTLIAEDVSVTATPVFVQDTILDPDIFTVYDGCTFTTGVPSRVHGRAKPAVRPNPTPGRFTVEFQDPLMKDSYYSVYDTMGKLLFQRAAAHGQKTEEVDLTGYSKGTYVIRFTDKEGTCYERVVVE